MRLIDYYVAVSLDGFICGPGADISGFVPDGNGIAQYVKDLASYDTVLMGRKTYEFGFRFGLQPGKVAYPGKANYVFSNSLRFENVEQSLHVRKLNITNISDIRGQPGTDIYLCGGGELAGWLLDNGQIGRLKVKLNPLILGRGTKLFGSAQKKVHLDLLDKKEYDHGLQILTYSIKY